jgi:hypothetical protein
MDPRAGSYLIQARSSALVAEGLLLMLERRPQAGLGVTEWIRE